MQSFQNYNLDNQAFKKFVCDMLSRIHDNQVDLDVLGDLDPEDHPFNVLYNEVANMRQAHLQTQSDLDTYVETQMAILKSITLDHVVITSLIKDLTDMVSKLCDKIDRLEERRGSQT
jgi:hypothetical protein